MLRWVACLLWVGAALAEEPASPLRKQAPKGERTGCVLLSTGEKLAGTITTTTGRPWRVFDRPSGKYADVDLAEVVRVDVAIEENTTEQVWRWKEAGSDEKVYTDQYYIWHKYLTTLELADGRKLTGDLQARVYVKTTEKKHDLDLHKRLKGPASTKHKLVPPVYIKEIVFDRAK